jgi:hypothetical protein
MSSGRRLGKACVACFGLLAFGCGAGAKRETGLSTARQAVTGGSPFNVATNPIITYDRAHYSSDPSVIVLDGFQRSTEASPEPLLALLTSTDLVDLPPENFPMDGTRLYATFGDDNDVFDDDNLATTWFEYGDGRRPEPVVQESDFDNWTLEGSNALFAPDIQFVPNTSEGQNSLFVYVPDVDQGGVKRIGVAEAKSPGGMTLFDHFVAKNEAPNDYFKILPGAAALGNNGLPPNNGYAFDPGVVFASDTVAVPPQTMPSLHEGFFMAYADGILSDSNGLLGHNLSLVQLSPGDMTAGTYLGKIGFSTYQSYSGLNAYMEGPDVHVMSTPSGSKHYYLVFAAQVEPLATDTSYIGYATCTPQEFWRAPTSCWKFKGWLFRNHHAGRNNQVSLVEFKEHYYVFFHRVTPLLNTTTAQGISRSREVCAKEIELIDDPGQEDDGEIRGVKPAANQNVARDFTTLDGLTRGMTKGIVQFRDESMPDTIVVNRVTTEATASNVTTNPATIRLASLRNDTGASSFRLHYFVDIEPGSNLVPQLSQQTDLNLKLATPPLKHVGGRTWAVVLDYVPTGPTNANIGGLLTLRYDVATAPFVRSNDFSQPVGNYYTWTSRVALMSTNDELLAGEVPEIVVPKRFRTSVPDADGKFTFLTVSFNDENVGINNQYLKTGSAAEQATQQWVVESASNFPYLADPDKPNAFRLRSLSAGFYMTANDVTQITQPSRPLYFFLLSQSLRPNWNSQIWIKEPVGEGAGSFRIRSAFLPYASDSPGKLGDPEFLTRDTTRTGNRGLQDVYVEPDNSPDALQQWVLEDVPQSHFLRTFAIDADSKFTYLALTATSENAGINNQYLNTGVPGEEWVMEPATDFPGFASLASADQPNAYRFRNVQTGFYMTSNDDATRQPHFQLLDQALHADWNTQVWIVESPGVGPTRLRCAFSPGGQVLFLTRNINNPSSNRGTQSVFVQPADSTNGDRQKWFIE